MGGLWEGPDVTGLVSVVAFRGDFDTGFETGWSEDATSEGPLTLVGFSEPEFMDGVPHVWSI